MNPISEFEKIICGDALEVMKEMPDNFIDMVLTSPPYDNLREYQGYDFNFEAIAKELFRVVKEGGVVVWVVGDQTINGSETGTSFRQALFFKEIGFNLHDTMVYQKANYMPQNHGRYDQSFEFMFVFSKGIPKTFNPIMEKCSTAGDFYNYAQRKSASTKEKKVSMRKRDEKLETKEEKCHSNIFSYMTGGNKSTKDEIAFEHPATFPEQLAADHIKSWSNEGDLILDPMNGSGTTTKIAKLLKRDYIGIEISKKYCEIAEKRLQAVNPMF